MDEEKVRAISQAFSIMTGKSADSILQYDMYEGSQPVLGGESKVENTIEQSENIDQKKMSIKDSQDEPDMRIDLCHKCNSYIKTYVGESEKSAGKEGWASIHLDLLMKDSGFSPKGCLVKP